MTKLGLHNLTGPDHQTSKRVGRGNASGRGNYSGRGLKGQRSRSGGKSGLKRRGLTQLLHSKPKLGGFKSHYSKDEIVNVKDLEKVFSAGELVTPKKMFGQGLIKTLRQDVKILGSGKLSKKLVVVANSFSESAKQAIMEAGGEVKLVILKKKSSKKNTTKKS